MKAPICFLFFLHIVIASALAQSNTDTNKFRPLDDLLPTPNTYRTASGAPGHEYWQQKVDYKISVVLDDNLHTLRGEEIITYHNLSPDPLNYLWVQLDQNKRRKNSLATAVTTTDETDNLYMEEVAAFHSNYEGGFNIEQVRSLGGNDLSYTINETMMRIDLPNPLLPGDSTFIRIRWWYNINDRALVSERSGMEFFPRDSNYVYIIAQFYPRMAVYSDVEGWQNKQFLGQGEFALCFGDFEVNITVPADHVVAASGLLQNPSEVLSTNQRLLLEKALTSPKPVLIVDEATARAKETQRSPSTKTWKFKATHVRDFAFASSRKFIWDAMGVEIGGKTAMAMSFYPPEGNPLWGDYATKIIAHTLKVYSKHTFDFPYPVAQAVHADNIGMEYPMISFNGGRPYENGTYSAFIRNYMISVIIHEVGHNFFPMIVNSDERQWAWMDEGINTFLQYLAEQEFEENYPSWCGPATSIIDYMSGPKKSQSPIMTRSETALQLGYNAYFKPATALNILRQTIMGPELFDYAFKEYSQRWMYKHPTPADFFRTMEDASGVDLDWFWRGWFFTTDHVDISIDKVVAFKPGKDKGKENGYEVIALSNKRFAEFFDGYRGVAPDFDASNYYYWKITFSNRGGLVMPLIIGFEYEDGSTEIVKVPVEIWLRNNEKITRLFATEKKVHRIVLDPQSMTADINTDNNVWPAGQPFYIPGRSF